LEATADWKRGIEKEVILLKDKMSRRDYKLYELDLLLRVAKQVAALSSYCEYCQGHRNEISKLVADLKNLPEIITKENVADYRRTFGNIMNHLEKNHDLRRDPMKDSKSTGGEENSKKRQGCSIIAMGCIVSPILFIVGFLLSIRGQSFLESTPEWPIFWLFTSLSIAVFVISIVYLLKKS
jgi:hypothetical protein